MNVKKLIALVIGAYLTLQKTEALAKEEEAAEEMWGVIFPDVEVAGMSTNQPMVVQLDNISKKHTGTKAAANAQFLAASEFFDQGKYIQSKFLMTKSYLGNIIPPMAGPWPDHGRTETGGGRQI